MGWYVWRRHELSSTETPDEWLWHRPELPTPKGIPEPLEVGLLGFGATVSGSARRTGMFP
jgi:hypothetical protein